MIKTTKFILPILVIIWIVLSFTLSAGAADAVVANETGFTLGQLLLGWRIMTSGFIEPGKIIQDANLAEIIRKLDYYTSSADTPDFIQQRLERLEEKYTLAQTKFLWKYQSGYWSCNSEENLKLSGPEIQSDFSEQKGQEFLYLQFDSSDDYALVNLADKYLSPPLEKYTLEFWVRPSDVVTGLLLQAADWSLSLRSNKLSVRSPVFQEINVNRQLIANHWNHLTLISSGAEFLIYIDGSLVHKAQLNSPLLLSNELKFGGGFVGSIDEIRVKPRQVKPLEIHFDQPIDYSIGYPFASWIAETLSDSELWRFYSSLLVSGLKIKQESQISSVDPRQLGRISEVLLGEVEGVPPPPASLPRTILHNLEAMSSMASKDKLSSEDKEVIFSTLTDLMEYLELT